VEKPSHNQNVWVVIPASGVGSRMNADVPKQYLQIQGKTILEHTVSKFAPLTNIAGILVLISEDDTYWVKIKDALLVSCQSQGLRLVSCFGGSERSETVLRGLAFLINEQKLNSEQWVMVHDAARPCVREMDIIKLLASRSNSNTEGAILATPVKDTLKLADNNTDTILITQPRKDLWQAQTPQLFQLGALYDALQKAKHAKVLITDEASAMEYSNKFVQLVEGASDNIKLTTPADLHIIDYLLRNSEKKNEY